MRPLTDRLPKCMLPLGNRPLLAYILEHLQRHKFADIFINLHWRPDVIRDCFGDGADFGLRIHYLHEKQLSGTAGPVRKLESDLADDRFLVLYGDNFTDLDLTHLIAFHDGTGAELTVALHQETPTDLAEKSVVETSADGRLVSFVEKPRPEELTSEWSSAGIYVFKPSIINAIPQGRTYDIGHDLIPLLLRTDRRVYGYKSDFYLVDIGTPLGYSRASEDVLASRLR